jgi:hypothetical protein
VLGGLVLSLRADRVFDALPTPRQRCGQLLPQLRGGLSVLPAALKQAGGEGRIHVFGPVGRRGIRRAFDGARDAIRVLALASSGR